MNHIFQTFVLIMECIKLNWLCKHIKRSEAANQPFLYWIECNNSLSLWLSLNSQETSFLNFSYFVPILFKIFRIHWSPRSMIVSMSGEQTLHKKWSFPLRFSSVNVIKCDIYWRNPGKLHFLCSEKIHYNSFGYTGKWYAFDRPCFYYFLLWSIRAIR